LLRSLPAERVDEQLNQFDQTCIDAARLLEVPAVAAWMAAAYPLVVVDEAQDLDAHRFRMLQGISAASCVVAAADDFQNLNPRIDTNSVMEWLRAADHPVRLSRIRRTSQDGLLRVAGALRQGRDVCAELRYDGRFHGCHSGNGIRVVESPARNAGALTWAVANELSQVCQEAVVLTPDATGERVREVLARVQSLPPFNRNRKAGTTFGPYPLMWEQREEDDTAALLALVPDEDWLAVHEAISAFSRIGTGIGRYVCERLARIRSVRGEQTITRERLGQITSDVLRDTRRHRQIRQFPSTLQGQVALITSLMGMVRTLLSRLLCRVRNNP
jgi:AAA domain